MNARTEVDVSLYSRGTYTIADLTDGWTLGEKRKLYNGDQELLDELREIAHQKLLEHPTRSDYEFDIH